MTASVAIIDYGSGNLRSAAKAFERAVRTLDADIDIAVTADPEIVRRADRIVLPGVGAFADCKAGLMRVTGMLDVLEERVIKGGAPFLGICVGMQLMATEGREKGITPGLGWIPGAVVRLEPAGRPQGPAHGLEHAALHAAAPAARRHPRWRGRAARLFRPLLSPRDRRSGDARSPPPTTARR